MVTPSNREALRRYADASSWRYRRVVLPRRLNILRRFAAFVGIPLAQVTTRDFEEWIAIVASVCTVTTTRFYHLQVRAYYAFLEHESGGAIRNPIPPPSPLVFPILWHRVRRTQL